ncbi:hypothetical protein DPX16_11204 [Anabarilius grahami]|uniref:Uncharacterized protein n=1 Tax=Anabarilius grahami TaxID=495550 RepID=A0A3N0Y2H8_ANAGA|nr:hypothetical protein DPX16_11204 [Anabarilius grahami]
MFELRQEPMRFVLVLRSTFELPQEPMRFILVLRSTFELRQVTVRFILVLRSTSEIPQEPMRFILVLRSTFELLHKPKRFVLKREAGEFYKRTDFESYCMSHIVYLHLTEERWERFSSSGCHVCYKTGVEQGVLMTWVLIKASCCVTRQI